ncbi:hypothetical protein JR316_0003839 [Psilocybe cubensis]|uniref:Uncharacterized protein n=2 Tax=Psilocybe cubensis TaxID=181762 RepID=A0ACB8H8V6_PSICU|nr:hypothetical protein JR316_0003839 [Psilocybe cubensis]KAH9484358.1 hypothetical protein JR316_0003839 [Psilocybe cubensis]
MQFASPGVRNVARKGSNILIHGHGGPGGSTSNTNASRSIHLNNILNPLHSPHLTLPGLNFARNPSHKLFSASRNALQKFFSLLTAPGFRAPVQFTGPVSRGTSRSLHNAIRGSTIQSGLSLPARQALRNNALQRQANIFLPRAPNLGPPRFGGVAQVGLGTARNFSSARPIFQQLAENVPVAGRALYEIDWDVEMRKNYEGMLLLVENEVKKPLKTKEMIKPVCKKAKMTQPLVESNGHVSTEDLDYYFPHASTCAVTTYLLIPLAPTPTLRAPLPPNPTSSSDLGGWEPTLLPPLSYLGNVHASHSTHAIRVSSLFSRLDQANVWNRGVKCTAYSHGQVHRRRDPKSNDVESDEGVCTFLKVEFLGWTKAEVRSVIGESGSGWCTLEEVISDEQFEEDDSISDTDSLSSGLLEDGPSFVPPVITDDEFGSTFDLSQSFVLPTIDFSPTSTLPIGRSQSMESILSTIPSEMEADPWADEYSTASSSSICSDFEDLIVEPPSANGWFDSAPIFSPAVLSHSRNRYQVSMESGPQEGMFY